MVTLQIANHNIHQVLVDTKSLVEVLFHLTYNHMGLLPTIVKQVDTLFYSFSGHCIRPSGEVKLFITESYNLAQATVLTNFPIVNTSDVYNAII